MMAERSLKLRDGDSDSTNLIYQVYSLCKLLTAIRSGGKCVCLKEKISRFYRISVHLKKHTHVSAVYRGKVT